MNKVSIGIPVPVSGGQSSNWWSPLVKHASMLHEHDIEIVDIIPVMSMMVDVNRNKIVEKFLDSEAEWLRWLDADNVDPLGSLRWQLAAQKSLITGLYIKRNDQGEPVAYQKLERGYGSVTNFTTGEIIPIDGAGLGGCLVHRTVFEDIMDNYRTFDLDDGGVLVAHKDDIVGDIFDDDMKETDGKIVDGVYQLRVRKLTEKKTFPFFMLEHGRSEDYGFFEKAKRVGHQLWLDTGIEIGHIGEKVFRPQDVRRRHANKMRAKYHERTK